MSFKYNSIFSRGFLSGKFLSVPVATCLTAVLFSLSSCSDEAIVSSEDNHDDIVSSGPYDEAFDVMVESFSPRTRFIEFEEGSTVRLNKTWFGVFDFEGNLVGQQFYNQDYAILSSGQESPRILRIDYTELLKKYPGIKKGETQDNEYFIVVVANSTGVKGKRPGDNELSPLDTLLFYSTSWKDFNEIGVDTYSAYQGDHNTDTPLMAGFVNSKSAYKANIPSSTHIKIDQFNKNPGVHLTPEVLLNETPIMESLKVNYGVKNARFVTLTKDYLDATVYLRRLVSNIRVNISVSNEAKDKISITDVSYRRFNEPNYVYIIERTLLDSDGNFPSSKELSPNFSDLVGEGGYRNDDDDLKDIVHSNDKEEEAENAKNWLHTTVSQDPNGTWSFQFQHFANKHWSRKDYASGLQEYSDREKRNNDGSFWALANNKDDFNNNASYFIIKMHIVDHENKRCAEAEFLIHEGYTSDDKGYATDDEKIQLQDFSCARNIDYNYNIEVAGIENIFVNVDRSDRTDLSHRADMAGRIWNMHYVNDPLGTLGTNYSDGRFYQAIGAGGGLQENAVTIYSTDTDFAFRLYGYDSTPEVQAIRAYNYNFPPVSFSWLSGLWPPSSKNAIYYLDYDALLDAYENNPQIETLLFNTFKIIDAEDYDPSLENDFDNFDSKTKDSSRYNYWMDIVQFIRTLEEYKTDPTVQIDDKHPRHFHIYVQPRQIEPVPRAEKDNYIRALYLGDRNGIVDFDHCTTLVNISAAIQDPPVY